MDDTVDYITSALPDLLKLLQSSDVRELDVQDGEMRVRLHRSPSLNGHELPAESGHVDELLHGELQVQEVTAPLVGTFYRASEPSMPPLVEEGSRVEDHTVVGIIEALSHLTEVEASCAGTVTRVLATDGQPVQYGQPLFEVAPGG